MSFGTDGCRRRPWLTPVAAAFAVVYWGLYALGCMIGSLCHAPGAFARQRAIRKRRKLTGAAARP